MVDYWLVIEYLVNLFECIILVDFLSSNLEKKYLNKRYLEFIASFFLSFVLTLSNMMSKISFPGASLISLILFLVTVLIVSRIVYGDNIIKRINTLGVFVILVIIAEIAAVGILALVFSVPIKDMSITTVYRLVGLLISKLFLFLLIKVYCRKKFKGKEMLFLYNGATVLIILADLFLVVSLFYFYVAVGEDTLKIYVIISIGSMLLLNYLILYLVERMIRLTEDKTKYMLIEQQYDMQVKYIKEFTSYGRELRSIKHDINNHMQVLKGFLSTGNINRVKEYLSDITGKMEIYKFIDITPNLTIATILNYKIKEAEKEGIHVDYKIIVPKDLYINDIDISIVLNNALDNAIEACKKISDAEKMIKINIFSKKNYIIIRVINSILEAIPEDNNDFLKTSKTDKFNHGIGLLNVKNTVEKYNGSLDLIIGERSFTFIAALMNKHDHT